MSVMPPEQKQLPPPATKPDTLFDVSDNFLGELRAWLQMNGFGSSFSGADEIPAGAISLYGGSTAPSDWVLCDGGTYDGTDSTYTALWNVIGLTYGGTGQASFKVPDLRGRVPVMLGTHTSVDALGETEGVAIAARTPKHYHTESSGVNAGTSIGSGGQPDNMAAGGLTTDQTGPLNSPAYIVLQAIVKL